MDSGGWGKLVGPLLSQSSPGVLQKGVMWTVLRRKVKKLQEREGRSSSPTPGGAGGLGRTTMHWRKKAGPSIASWGFGSSLGIPAPLPASCLGHERWAAT